MSRIPIQTALIAFAGSAVAFLFYQRHQFKETKKTRNLSLGSNQELTTDIISQIVTTNYNLTVKNCTNVKRGFNHNYLIETEDEKTFLLRVYLNDKYYIRDSDDFRFELEFMDYLHQQGGPVVGVIKEKGGDLLSNIQFDEKGELSTEVNTPYTRHAALLEQPPGQEVSLLNRTTQGKFMGPPQFHALGVVMAQLHQAADEFPNANHYHRYHQDITTYLLDYPLQQLVTWGMGGQLDFFQSTAKWIRRKIDKMQRTTPAYGLIHGDLHSGNLFCEIDKKQFTVVDWDHCSYGWRVYEFAWLSRMIPATSFEALVRGYESIRPLSKEERELIPVFALLRDLWDMGDVLAFGPLRSEGMPTRSMMARNMAKLKSIQTKVKEMQEKEEEDMDEVEEARGRASAVLAPAPAPLPMNAPAPAPAPASPPRGARGLSPRRRRGLRSSE